MTYNYFLEPNERYCQAMNNYRCYLASGRSIGGSSQVNHMLYFTGNRRDYDGWCGAGNTGWCFDDLRRYFKKITTPVVNSSHPVGYLPVNPYEEYDTDYVPLLLQAAREMDQNIIGDFLEAPHFLGYGKAKGNQKNGRRLSVAKTYLSSDITKRPNLKILKNAEVTKLHFDTTGKRVVSLEFMLQNKFRYTSKVGKEVILSAGTIVTPKILMLSGIGPRNVLCNAGIPVVHDLPVGLNLQDHTLSAIFVKVDSSVKGHAEDLDNLYNYLVHSKGPLGSVGANVVTGFIKADANSSNLYPDLGMYHLTWKRGETSNLDLVFKFLPLKEEFRQVLRTTLETNDIMLISFALLNPVSRGSVQVRTPSFLDDPVIDANYFEASRDSDIMLYALQFIQKFVSTPSFLEKHAEIIQMPLPECGEEQFGSREYWKCYIKYITNTGFHPVGTAKMGRINDATSVVSPRLLVKGVDNLRVADASIMPSIPSVNTNGPTIMVGEKAADLIKEDWHRKENDNLLP